MPSIFPFLKNLFKSFKIFKCKIYVCFRCLYLCLLSINTLRLLFSIIYFTYSYIYIIINILLILCKCPLKLHWIHKAYSSYDITLNLFVACSFFSFLVKSKYHIPQHCNTLVSKRKEKLQGKKLSFFIDFAKINSFRLYEKKYFKHFRKCPFNYIFAYNMINCKKTLIKYPFNYFL